MAGRRHRMDLIGESYEALAESVTRPHSHAHQSRLETGLRHGHLLSASRGGCHREAVRALLARDPNLKLGHAYRPTSQARIVGRWNCADLLALVDR